MPPPTLKIDVNKEVTKDSAAKILMNSKGHIRVCFNYKGIKINT